MKKAILLIILISLPASLSAHEPVDLKIISQIKSEGFNNSKIMETMFYLTDVHGPRLTNSPNYKAASQWCVEKLKEWGLTNCHLESWGTFGKGWAVESFSVEMVEPQYLNMIAYPKAWTPGTDGAISGVPILLDVKSEEGLEQYKGTLQGAIVMIKPTRHPEPHFEADAKRHSEEDLSELFMAPEPGKKPSWWLRREEFRKRRALRKKVDKFLREEGAAIVLEGSQREHGTILVQSGGSYKMDAEPVPPAVVVAIEHYLRVVRLFEKEIPVNLRIDVKNNFFTEDSLGYNVIGEIKGTDKRLRDEVVMLGGHLDSWHAGTGATDNAAGCAVTMEAVRILQAIGIRPRRTIRLALWGGEEQGLLGSKGYVKKHFGDVKSMDLKPEHDKFSAYYNLDNGTGKLRGIYLQENDTLRPIFESWLEPFHDRGAETVTIRNTTGTDHISFNAIGLPGFQFIQDPIEYRARTHHTNMDVYDHAVESDLMQASVIMASFVYNTAMRDKKLPRKPLPKPKETPPANGH